MPPQPPQRGREDSRPGQSRPDQSRSRPGRPAAPELPARGSGFDGALPRPGAKSKPAGSKPAGLRADGTPRRSSPVRGAKVSSNDVVARDTSGASRTGRRIPPPPEVRPPAAGPRAADVWVDEGPTSARPEPSGSSRRPKVPKPQIDPKELVPLVGAKRAKTLNVRLAEAAVAFASERFPDARRILRPIVEEAPGSPTARELLGLTQYRLGNWNDAAKHLEELRQMTGYSVDQHPVLADCYRALKRHALVDELWAELREASPSAELVTEGRLVAAGSLADRGRLGDAVRELERGWKIPKSPRFHHLRRAYALADLYERSGEVPKARSLMGWVAEVDPEFADVQERLQVLR